MAQPPFAQKKTASLSGPAMADPAAAMPPDQEMPAGEEDIDAITEVESSPEEEAQYDVVAEHAAGLIKDESGFNLLVDMTLNDPYNSVVEAALTIIKRTEQDLGPQDPDLLRAVAEEDLIPRLCRMSEAANEENGNPIEITEDIEGQITAAAIGKWSEANKDRIQDPESVKAMGQSTMDTLGIKGGQSAQPAPQQPPMGGKPV